MSCTEEDQCGRTGRKTGNDRHESHFGNEELEIEFQTIAYKVDVEDLLMLPSVAFNSRADIAK